MSDLGLDDAKDRFADDSSEHFSYSDWAGAVVALGYGDNPICKESFESCWVEMSCGQLAGEACHGIGKQVGRLAKVQQFVLPKGGVCT